MSKQQARVTMADRIIAGMPAMALPCHDPNKDDALQSFCDYLRDEIKEMIVIESSDVAEYYFQHAEPKGQDLVRTIPNMAPPFDKFFIEFDSIKELGKKTGCFFWATRIANILDLNEFLETRPEWSGVPINWRDGADLDNPLWHLQCVAAITKNGGFSPMLQHSYVIDSNGQSATKESPSYMLGSRQEFETQSFHNSLHRASIMVGLFAISFMHCKNVNIKENEPNVALSKSFKKRHGQSLVRYHTIEIEPMKKVLKNEGGIDCNGLKKALHICRGHFATYSEERPLFGKLSGTFWMPAHVRGNREVGEVKSNYIVNAPPVAVA